MEKHGFFEDPKGNKSATRVMAFLALITALIIALAGVFLKDVTLGNSLPMVITLLAYSMGAKSFQAAFEITNQKGIKSN